MPGEDGYDLLRWLRREAKEPNRFAPAILVTGHTRISQIKRARDCGAHFVVSKPIQAKVLLERGFWVARTSGCSSTVPSTPTRPPLQVRGPPPGEEGRRDNDLPPRSARAPMPTSVRTNWIP